MTTTKTDTFRCELDKIKTEEIRMDAEHLISKLPDYFFEIPAASTGKYHPSYAQGEGGLVRHTKAAFMIADLLLQDPAIGKKYTEREKDIMLLALLIHDGFKLGKEKERYTRFDHPLLAGELVKEEKEHLHLSDDEITLLCSSLASHMGPWNKDFNDNVVTPEPKTKYENFVHMCDYLASRKTLLVPFDDNNNILY